MPTSESSESPEGFAPPTLPSTMGAVESVAKEHQPWTGRIPVQARRLQQEASEALQVSRWSLRGKMVLATVALLTGICFVVGFVCYASMSLSLNGQLNSNLTTASKQVTLQVGEGAAPGRYIGLPIGTLSAEVHSGHLDRSPSITARSSGSLPLETKDVDILTSIKPSDRIVNKEFSFGDYRLISASDGEGGTIVTGIPTDPVNKPLAALLFTILAVSAAGIIAMGLVATAIIRKALAPLNQLASVATRVSKLPLDEGEVKLAERAPPSAANDFSEVGTVGLALNKMLDNVASALQSRQRSETKVRQFVADASHELRTPLTAIRGYTEMIKMTEDLSPNGDKSLDRVESQSKRMAAMVEDLLTLARLDEGKPLELKDTELTQLVVETVHDLKVAIPNHEWKLDLSSDPFLIRADSGALRQVLTNLLSNAAKHTDPGTTVTTHLRSLDQDTVRIIVQDNGQGIAPEFQEHIFDRFARADAARSGHDGTTGLGLSIVYALVSAHGGEISVQSVSGDTRFIVDLPRGRAASENADGSGVASDGGTGNGRVGGAGGGLAGGGTGGADAQAGASGPGKAGQAKSAQGRSAQGKSVQGKSVQRNGAKPPRRGITRPKR